MSSLTQRNSAARAAFKGTYAFRKKEKDPVISAFATLLEEQNDKVGTVAARANISPGTIKNWIDGDTYRPQHCTMAAAVKALGYEFAIVQSSKRVNGHAIKALAPRIIRDKL